MQRARVATFVLLGCLTLILLIGFALLAWAGIEYARLRRLRRAEALGSDPRVGCESCGSVFPQTPDPIALLPVPRA